MEKIDKSIGDIVDCGVRYGIEILPLHLLIGDDGDTCDEDDDSSSGGGGDCGGDRFSSISSTVLSSTTSVTLSQYVNV